MEYEQYPKTRKEAQTLGAKYYFTGEPCKHGHVAPRKTRGACVECLQLEWRSAATTRTGYQKEYRQRTTTKERQHEWYEANRADVIARAKTRPASVRMVYQNAWKERNPVQVLADVKVRRKKHREATPSWLTYYQRIQMREIYKSAITLSRITGTPYVVDHIYPLRGAEVCGLHVPWNLRVVTRAENLKKSNQLPGEEEALARQLV